MNSGYRINRWQTIQKRSVRLALLAFYIIIYAIHWAITLGNIDKQIVFAPITFGLAVFSSFLLSLSIARITDKSDRQLDERQKTVRDGAYRIAFQILIFVGMIFVLIIGNTGILLVNQHRNTFISSLFICAVTIPVSVIAWLEPEPISNPE